MRIGTEEARVAGSLIEKRLTTPQQYPLTLNALVLACNQTSNRDPVVNYDESVVEVALSDLKDRRLVRFVLPSHGRSVVRYRQVLDEVLGVDDRQLALLAVLLLRGPQTVGELRTRTERMVAFEDLDSIQHDLELMADMSDGLVERLGRRPGQKEERWVQLLSDGQGPATVDAETPDAETPDAETAASVTELAPVGFAGAAPGTPGSPANPPTRPVADLQSEVSALRSEVEALRSELAQLRSSLGG
ncbi:MAG TPA: DUF480 domain-containing protein [Acidimicrobiales bacterium]